MVTEQTWFYVSLAQAERSPLSTALVLRGCLNSEYEGLVGAFCRIVAQQADFLMLVEQQRLAQRQYRERVAEVAHDFRTPLQVLVFDLQEVARLDPVKNDPVLLGRVERSVERAMQASEHVHRLLDAAVEDKHPLDLVALIRKVMKDLEPIAERHPCHLQAVGEWPKQLTVRGVDYQLRRAFTNLIENAIKYSWCGKYADGKYERHTIGVAIASYEKRTVRVRIRNYGVGIPHDKLDQIREPGSRARVPDARRERAGTGWGLPIAVRVLEDHHGWLDICSEPADDRPRSASERYHRYVTTVDAYLPTAK